MHRQYPLVETTPIRDIFCNGVSSVELIAPHVRRITLFALRTNAFDGRVERDIVLRIIMADNEIMLARNYLGECIQPAAVKPCSADISRLFNH